MNSLGYSIEFEDALAEPCKELSEIERGLNQ